MKHKINNSINHLKQLNDNPFTLQKVAFWLYEYDDLYKEVKSYSKSNCLECQELAEQGLPFNCLQDAEHCTKKYRYFTDFYEEADYGIRIQELEPLCKIALDEYHTCNNNLQLKEWLIKYFDIGYNKLVLFYYDHLDYSVKKGEVIHPHFGNSPIGEFGVCIDRKHYENIIEFENVFRVLFYDKKLYPEKLKEIDEEMQKIVIPLMPIPKYK